MKIKGDNMILIDFHCHVGKDSDEGSLSFKELKKSMDRWGINKAVVFPFNKKEDKKLIEDSLKILEKSKEENWIIPFLRFNPKTTSKEELNNLLNNGFKGVKLHPEGQNFKPDDERFYWIYEMCQKNNLPLLFHCSVKSNNSHPLKIINIVKKFPRLKIIMAHFFGNDFSVMKIANKFPNLYTDTSINSGSFRRKLAVEKQLEALHLSKPENTEMTSDSSESIKKKIKRLYLEETVISLQIEILQLKKELLVLEDKSAAAGEAAAETAIPPAKDLEKMDHLQKEIKTLKKPLILV